MNVLDYIELTRYALFRFIILFGLFLVGPVWMLFLEWRLNFENSTLVAGHFATRNTYFLVPRAREHKSSEHTLSHALLYYLRSLQRSFDSANSTTRASYIFIFCLIKCINSFNGLRHEMTQINTHTVAGTYSFKRNDVLITSRITRTFRTFFFDVFFFCVYALVRDFVGRHFPILFAGTIPAVYIYVCHWCPTEKHLSGECTANDCRAFLCSFQYKHVLSHANSVRVRGGWGGGLQLCIYTTRKWSLHDFVFCHLAIYPHLTDLTDLNRPHTAHSRCISFNANLFSRINIGEFNYSLCFYAPNEWTWLERCDNSHLCCTRRLISSANSAPQRSE